MKFALFILCVALNALREPRTMGNLVRFREAWALTHNAIKFLVTMLFISAQTFGQGQIIFNNRNLQDPVTGAPYHAPVSLPDGTRIKGSQFTAGLFLVQPSELLLIATSEFRSEDWAVGFLKDPRIVEVPGVPPHFPATFRFRVWETSAGSYENAVSTGLYFGDFALADGETLLFIPALGTREGPGMGIIPRFNGIQPLTLTTVPEPTVVLLLLVGSGLLWLVATRERNPSHDPK